MVVDRVRDDGRDDRQHEHFRLKVTRVEDLRCIDRSAERGTEDRTDARAHTGGEGDSPVPVTEADEVGP